jgi:hypothetical protein
MQLRGAKYLYGPPSEEPLVHERQEPKAGIAGLVKNLITKGELESH